MPNEPVITQNQVKKPPPNPQAFPRSYSARQRADSMPFTAQDGMTLRDYFASAAMEGLGHEEPSVMAQKAYEFADAMLKERVRQ